MVAAPPTEEPHRTYDVVTRCGGGDRAGSAPTRTGRGMGSGWIIARAPTFVGSASWALRGWP